MSQNVSNSTIVIPTLRQWNAKPASFDASTCYEAGHLVERNAGWRQQRPVLDGRACTSCLQCYMYCPDGAIRKTHAEEGSGEPSLFVDLDFCKGCGICVTVCRFDALAMVSEKGFADER